MFGMHFVHSMQPELFQKNEWEFFTGDLVDSSLDNAQQASPNFPVWAAPDRANIFRSFEATFGNLVRQLRLADESLWRRWSEHPSCELPSEFPPHTRFLTGFQQLLLVQVFRPDRLHTCMNVFVCEMMKIKSVSPPTLILKKVYEEESQPVEPLLFVTTPGADPSQELEEFANEIVGRKNFIQLAMGQGQTDQALQCLHQAATEGQWLLLKNLHLVTAWLYRLEKELNTLQPSPNFRLFLTTEAHTNFPPMLLQHSLKITYESPPGLRENLVRTLSTWSPQFLASGNVTRAQMLFVLAWFHAIVQERRTYIPQGWTKFYEFSMADLRAGSDVIHAICSRYPNLAEIPFATIWGLMENSLYGGRLDNDQDLRVLTSYIAQYFHPDLFSAPLRGQSVCVAKGVVLPNSVRHEDYVAVANTLASTDNPQIFGLPLNIEGSVQRTSSTEIISQLKRLAVSASLTSKFNRDVWRVQLHPTLQLWTNLCSSNNNALLANAGRLAGRAEADLGPIDSFVLLEIAKAHQQIKNIDGCLSGVGRVVYQGGLLSPQIQHDGQILISGTVPWSWEKEWAGPSSPAAYLREVAMRRLALNKWLERVEQGNLLSQPIRLAELLNPSTFLNALLQQTARSANVAIDSLKLVSAFDRALLAANNAKVIVQLDGLLLQGAAFPGGRLSPLPPNSPSLSFLPPVYLAWISKSDPECYPEASSVMVPMYYCINREKLVCELRLPCQGDKFTWILSGVAVFLADF
eukprot:TRINITY_DN6084_c0_g1_i4.p1 TRINITY_DN6084_c0_g1~~TRINITY_DN6084_c0_g1_i4.p1  ORF type:complete len:746 (-),score=233.94 TRINITY_DN6084_c0_g1_i4:98-2335(-)